MRPMTQAVRLLSDFSPREHSVRGLLHTHPISGLLLGPGLSVPPYKDKLVTKTWHQGTNDVSYTHYFNVVHPIERSICSLLQILM